jgi:hypothetical protein
VKLYLFNLPDSIICCFSFGRVFRPRLWGRAVGHAHSAAPFRLPAGGRSLGRAFSGRARGLPSFAALSAAPSLAAPSWPRLCRAKRSETLLYCQRVTSRRRLLHALADTACARASSFKCVCVYGAPVTRVFALSAKCACDCLCLACALVARLRAAPCSAAPSLAAPAWPGLGRAAVAAPAWPRPAPVVACSGRAPSGRAFSGRAFSGRARVAAPSLAAPSSGRASSPHLPISLVRFISLRTADLNK